MAATALEKFRPEHYAPGKGWPLGPYAEFIATYKSECCSGTSGLPCDPSDVSFEIQRRHVTVPHDCDVTVT